MPIVFLSAGDEAVARIYTRPGLSSRHRLRSDTHERCDDDGTPVELKDSRGARKWLCDNPCNSFLEPVRPEASAVEPDHGAGTLAQISLAIYAIHLRATRLVRLRPERVIAAADVAG
jgi:hypothetical protein